MDNDYPTGIRIGYRWLVGAGDAPATDNALVPLPQVVEAGETIQTRLDVGAPAEPGLHTLEVELVHEGLVRFKDRGSPGSRVHVRVVRPDAVIRGRRILRTAAARVVRRRPDGAPEMEMHGIPQAQVLELIEGCNASAVAADETHDAEAWQSFTYFAKKRAA